MVIISRIRTKNVFRASIRWKIVLAFFIVVGASFLVAATNLTDLVYQYLYTQRVRQDSAAVKELAESLSALYESGSFEELNEEIKDASHTLDGRLILTDNDGKVQFDSFDALCGSRVGLDEVLYILTGNETAAYGMYSPGRETVERMSGDGTEEYIAYCTREVMGVNGRLGVLLYVSRVQEMMDSLSAVRWQLTRVFAMIAVGALILALVISQILTKPISVLSRTMRKMGKGDLSVRVPVKGSGELRELAENYNTMAAQLESLDQSRNQFVSNASHELKTPLATMKIMLETMIYQPDMPAELRQEFMQDMNHEIDRLTGIITDLLTLTRMDTQSDALQLDTVDMSALTEETVHLLKPAAEKKGQTLTADVAPGLEMAGDRIKLNQVLYNLTDNAIKYSPEGGRISVSLKQKGPDLIWRVSDNGIGIPEEDREHIFERFYRVDKARSRETGGTGLGLSIVKQLVSMHGGSVSVEDGQNGGSVFTVILPREGGGIR